MTRARLTVWINWDPDGTGIGADLPVGANAMEIDINVEDGDEPIGITVTDQGVSMTSKQEPRMVVLPEPATTDALIHPDSSTQENIAHVLRGLRDGSNMTRANSAFIDLMTQLGLEVP